MLKIILLFTVFGTLALAACAPAGDQGSPISSASGHPEAYFATAPDRTGGTLASACFDHSWNVTESSTNQIVCELPLSATQSVLTQVLIGNAESTTPQKFVRFNIVPFGASGSRVQCTLWVETTMAFGQKQTVDMSSGVGGRQLQELLISAGGLNSPL